MRQLLRHSRARAPRLGIAVLASLSLVLVGQASAHAQTWDKQTMIDFATTQPVKGFSKLMRGSDGITTKIRTSAPAEHAVTFWYVVFNAPGNCNTGACGEDDLFIGGDPANGPNLEIIEKARISVVFGGDGAVSNPAGRLALDGGLAEGEVPAGANQVVIGELSDGALIPGPVTGLEDAQAAEIHIVLQSHGAPVSDPADLAEQLSGFMTHCNPECVDFQFAVHLP